MIHNPTAGRVKRRERHFQGALEILKAAGWKVDVRTTSSEGHASELAHEAALGGADIVVAAGGDGTINEVVQGLALTGAALGCLPLGTVNVWAREAGFSSDIERAARELVGGKRVALDLGRINDRFFLLMAGIGLDGLVTATLGDGKHRKQQLGVLPYVTRLLRVIPGFKGSEVDLQIDGISRHFNALMVLVANTRLYGGVARPTPHALADDGYLDVRVFTGKRPVHVIGHLIPFLLGSSKRSSAVVRAERVTIYANPPLHIQIDGDPYGSTPATITVEHHALQAIVPKSYVTSTTAGTAR
jgi:YegS/Rv2252/BmrU family lipid kinase